MAPPAPEASSSPSGESAQVDVSKLVFGVLESARTRDVVPFGSAFPSPLLFPLPLFTATAAIDLFTSNRVTALCRGPSLLASPST